MYMKSTLLGCISVKFIITVKYKYKLQEQNKICYSLHKTSKDWKVRTKFTVTCVNFGRP